MSIKKILVSCVFVFFFPYTVAEISVDTLCGSYNAKQCAEVLTHLARQVNKIAVAESELESQKTVANADDGPKDFADLFLSKTTLEGKYGRTDTTDTRTGEAGNSLGREIKESDVWEVKIATELPLDTSINFLTNGRDASFLKGFFFEANYSYGTTVDEKQEFDALNSSTRLDPETKSTDFYYVGLKYKSSLKDLIK